MRSALIILGCLVGGAVMLFLPMEDIVSASNNLIIAFTVLAGLLAQMIALTAVIFEPGRFSAASIREIGDKIKGVQTLNIGLFAI